MQSRLIKNISFVLSFALMVVLGTGVSVSAQKGHGNGKGGDGGGDRSDKHGRGGDEGNRGGGNAHGNRGDNGSGVRQELQDNGWQNRQVWQQPRREENRGWQNNVPQNYGRIERRQEQSNRNEQKHQWKQERRDDRSSYVYRAPQPTWNGSWQNRPQVWAGRQDDNRGWRDDRKASKDYWKSIRKQQHEDWKDNRQLNSGIWRNQRGYRGYEGNDDQGDSDRYRRRYSYNGGYNSYPNYNNYGYNSYPSYNTYGYNNYPNYNNYGYNSYPSYNTYDYNNYPYYGNNGYNTYGAGTGWKQILLGTVLNTLLGDRLGRGYNNGYPQYDQYNYGVPYNNGYNSGSYYNAYPQYGAYNGSPYNYGYQPGTNYYEPAYGDYPYSDGAMFGSPIGGLSNQYSGGFVAQLIRQALGYGYDQGIVAGRGARYNGTGDRSFYDPYAYDNAIYDPYSVSLGENRRYLSEGYELGFRDGLNARNQYDPRYSGDVDLVSLLLSNVLSMV